MRIVKSLLLFVLALTILNLLPQKVSVAEKNIPRNVRIATYTYNATRKIHNANFLRQELEQAGVRTFGFEIVPRSNCRCNSTLAIVRSARGDGTNALLLNAHIDDPRPQSKNSFGARVVLVLAQKLVLAQWLAKDVVILLPSCCSCASRRSTLDSKSGWPDNSCSSAPLLRFIQQYKDSALPFQIGNIDQAISFSYSPSKDTALCVGLHAPNGRLPNLDMYAMLLAGSGHHSVNIPLHLLPEIRVNSDAYGFFRHTVYALNYGARVFAGFSGGPHSDFIANGIDSLSLIVGSPCRSIEGSINVSERKVHSLFYIIFRSLSNLEEPLHHSHYFYLPTSIDSFVPLLHVVLALVIPSILSLSIDALVHYRRAIASQQDVTSNLSNSPAFRSNYGRLQLQIFHPILMCHFVFFSTMSAFVFLLRLHLIDECIVSLYLVMTQIIWIATVMMLTGLLNQLHQGDQGKKVQIFSLFSGVVCTTAAFWVAGTLSINFFTSVFGSAGLALVCACIPSIHSKDVAKETEMSVVGYRILCFCLIATISPAGSLISFAASMSMTPLDVVISQNGGLPDFPSPAVSFACVCLMPISACVAALLLGALPVRRAAC